MSGPGPRLFLAAIAVVTGCASSSRDASPAPVSDATLPDGGKDLSDLTDEEALALCEWESERLHYGNCLDDAILLSRSASCADSLAACTAPDVVASKILDCAAGTLDTAEDCGITVGQRLKCDTDLKRQYDALPSCDRLTEQAFKDVLYAMSPPTCAALRCP